MAASLPAPAAGDDVTTFRDLRQERKLEAARAMALRLAASRPADADALLAASIAESDALAWLPTDARTERAQAAWSALDFAERAVAAGSAPDADALAQLARAIGGTIHLRPMFARSDAAWQTADAIERALAIDPDHADAHATRAVLRLRLATLPGIARLFAGDTPEASLETALTDAGFACASEPSVENRLLLAKILDAAGRSDEAQATRELARTSAPAFPRDAVLQATLDG